MEILGYDDGGNIKAKIEGISYKFATQEFYGGTSVYGICFPGDSHYTFLSRSKKAAKLYKQHSNEISQYLKANPMP